MNIVDIIRESNRIEGITRAPTGSEIAEHHRIISLPRLSVLEVVTFVAVYQPGAVLRDRPGLDVMVGNHHPPRGGPHITDRLHELLDLANDDRRRADPWDVHLKYEDLHPFTDGNGRSGRMVWYWMMKLNPLVSLGFLHAFYYQTLRNVRRNA